MSGETTFDVNVTDTRSADRFVYVFMAMLFIATAIVGFAPTSSALISAVVAGQRPAPPLVLHFHAVSMSSWLALLLVQTSLVATGRSALHRRLGMASLVVAPAVVASLILMSFGPIVGISRLTLDELTALHIDVDQIWGFLVTQIRAIVLFAVFVGWAFIARRTDRETHKRMMILATLAPLNAALGRMVGSSKTLPGGELFESHLVPDFYQVLLLTPALIYDVVRLGRIHRAYLIGVVLLVATMIAAHFLSDAAWWLEMGHNVMGS